MSTLSALVVCSFVVVQLPPPPRKERAGVEFPGATWTSFDRYSRYGAIVRAVRANLGAGPVRVLDVGDDSGWLHTFDADISPVSVDVNVNPYRIDQTVAVVGSGSQLPVRDGAFPAVVSSDALEHVPPLGRADFLAELARASADLVVVAAPFDTAGVAGAEEYARRFVEVATGDRQPQLDEHADHGLPALDDAVAALKEAGLHVAVEGNGNLHDWLLGMVVKHQLAGSPGLADLDTSFDVLYNVALAERNGVAPYYRHVLVARHGAEPARAEPAVAVDSAAVDVAALFATLVAGGGTESVRTDLRALTALLVSRADQLDLQQQTAAEHLMERFSGVEATLADLQARLQHLQDLLGHPLRAVSGRLTRRSGGSDQ